MNELIFTAIIAVFVYMNFWFLVAMLRKRNDLADIAWGLGFIIVAGISLIWHSDFSARKILIFTLVLIWGLRLAIHIYTRNRGKAEDYRYQEWRKKWGQHFIIRTYIQVFIVQGFLLLLISAPILATGASARHELGILAVLGLIVWLVGFYFETVGDYQLRQFIKNPKNKGTIMRSGLWRYTRHPNYFGEVTLWWGIWLIALSVPYGWVSIIGPLTITFLILKVSGIPMLEKKYEGNQEFQDYKKNTNAFFPWWPKKV